MYDDPKLKSSYIFNLKELFLLYEKHKIKIDIMKKFKYLENIYFLFNPYFCDGVNLTHN